jgi:putative ABC transport system substrate-binding protein
MIARRDVMCGLLAIGVISGLRANAQPVARTLPRIIMVNGGAEAGARPFVQSFLQEMKQLGYFEKSNYSLDVYYADAEPNRLRELITKGVEGRPDILIVAGLIAARLARDATTTVPIVVATSSDLVDAGIVQSYARPGGNITGISDLTDESTVKRLELLKDALPKASRVALLTNPDFPATPKIERRVSAAAQKLGIRIISIRATDLNSLVTAIDSLARTRPDALLVGADSNAVQNAQALIERAAALHIPIAHFWPGTAEMGALISYQADIRYNFQRAASYTVRILKGAKPGTLPIELPTRYELVVNLKIAKSLGITFPQAILVRADRVIE